MDKLEDRQEDKLVDKLVDRQEVRLVDKLEVRLVDKLEEKQVQILHVPDSMKKQKELLTIITDNFMESLL